MQKACKALAQEFAEDAPAAEGNVVAFEAAQPARRGWSSFGYVGGAVAAAACVALIFAVRTREAQSAPEAGAVVAESTLPSTPATMVAASGAPRGGIERRAAPLSLRDSTATVTLGNVQNDPRFAWINDVQLAPLNIPAKLDGLNFQSDPALKSQNRTYTSDNQPIAPDVSWTAFRYQK